MTMNKREWIESEYKKWEERFIIPFEDEFNVKALLELRWQFLNTSENHVRTKSDLVVAMERSQKAFHFEPKKTIEKTDRKIMIVVNNSMEVKRIAEMFLHNMDNIVSSRIQNNQAEIKTSECRFYITTNRHEQLRGHRCQVLIDTTNDREIDKYVGTIPVLK